MGALPKRKYAKARQGKRRNHLGFASPSLNYCPQCHTIKLSHRVCPVCGSYAGRQVVEIEGPKKKTS